MWWQFFYSPLPLQDPKLWAHHWNITNSHVIYHFRGFRWWKIEWRCPFYDLRSGSRDSGSFWGQIVDFFLRFGICDNSHVICLFRGFRWWEIEWRSPFYDLRSVSCDSGSFWGQMVDFVLAKRYFMLFLISDGFNNLWPWGLCEWCYRVIYYKVRKCNWLLHGQ